MAKTQQPEAASSVVISSGHLKKSTSFILTDKAGKKHGFELLYAHTTTRKICPENERTLVKFIGLKYSKAEVSSTYRPLTKQARVMFDNTASKDETRGFMNQLGTYNFKGDAAFMDYFQFFLSDKIPDLNEKNKFKPNPLAHANKKELEDIYKQVYKESQQNKLSSFKNLSMHHHKATKRIDEHKTMNRKTEPNSNTRIRRLKALGQLDRCVRYSHAIVQKSINNKNFDSDIFYRLCSVLKCVHKVRTFRDPFSMEKATRKISYYVYSIEIDFSKIEGKIVNFFNKENELFKRRYQSKIPKEIIKKHLKSKTVPKIKRNLSDEEKQFEKEFKLFSKELNNKPYVSYSKNKDNLKGFAFHSRNSHAYTTHEKKDLHIDVKIKKTIKKPIFYEALDLFIFKKLSEAKQKYENDLKKAQKNKKTKPTALYSNILEKYLKKENYCSNHDKKELDAADIPRYVLRNSQSQTLSSSHKKNVLADLECFNKKNANFKELMIENNTLHMVFQKDRPSNLWDIPKEEKIK